jgi:hypothetical protein
MTSNQRLDSRSDREAYDRNGPSAQEQTTVLPSRPRVSEEYKRIQEKGSAAYAKRTHEAAWKTWHSWEGFRSGTQRPRSVLRVFGL